MEHHHDDLESVVHHLRASRPELSGLELDHVKQRVRARVASPRSQSRRTQLMKSRLTILAMLALGMGLSTTGAGLAVSGLSSDNNAAQHQYGKAQPPGPTSITTPGPTSGTTPGPTSGAAPAPGPTSGTLGEEDQGATLPEQDAEAPTQPTRQVEAGAQEQAQGGEELPFTGLAAIPILVGGVALLAGGLVLRRNAPKRDR
jgi:hypothetical protein